MERAGVFDAERGKHPAIELTQRDAEVFLAVGAERGFDLRFFHAQRRRGDPAEDGEHQSGRDEKSDRPADGAQ